MRIQVYRVDEGMHQRLLLPGRRARLAPILIRHADEDLVKQNLAEAIAFVRGARGDNDEENPVG